MTNYGTDVRIHADDGAIIVINCFELTVIPRRHTRATNGDPHDRLYGFTSDRAKLEQFSFDHMGPADVYGDLFACKVQLVPLGVTGEPGPLRFTFDLIHG